MKLDNYKLLLEFLYIELGVIQRTEVFFLACLG